MQISDLFDEYRIHENFYRTQPYALMMLVKTLVKLFEHIIQHPLAPLQAKPLRILFYEGSRRGDGGGRQTSAPCAHGIPRVRMSGIVRLRSCFGPLQFVSAASLSPRSRISKALVRAWNGGPFER
jgi:hypothetical protein